MSAIRKNVAGQGFGFGLVDATTGGAKTGATVSVNRTIDGGAQAAATGTVTEKGGGQYWFAASQADTNGNEISFIFTATGAIPVEKTIITTAADPTDGVRYGLTTLPNVVAGGNGGLPLADASGQVKAALTAIIATAISETLAGNLAGSFKKLLDVSAPALTAACINQTGDSYPIVNSGTSGNAALLAAIQNVQNNTFIATSIPQALQTPASGSVTVNITIVFSDDTGAAKNLDAGNPTIALVNDAGIDLSARLGVWTNPATGKYVVPYTSTSSDATEGLHWDVSGTINGKLRRMVAYTQIVDTLAIDFTSGDRTNLNNLIATVGTAGAGLTNLGDARIPAIKAQTDKLTFVGSNLQAIVEAYGASQDAWTIIKAAVPSATPGAGTVELLLRLLDADTKIDTTTTPWDLVFYVKGTATEILRKRLFDTSGVGVTNTTTVLGEAIQ